MSDVTGKVDRKDIISSSTYGKKKKKQFLSQFQALIYTLESITLFPAAFYKRDRLLQSGLITESVEKRSTSSPFCF